MDDKERAALIRKGNAAFNDGDIELAIKIFKATGYKDGLIRLGDHFFYEKEQPLIAYGYYRRAGDTKMLDRMSEAFTFALSCWMHDEKTPASTFDSPSAPLRANAQDKSRVSSGVETSAQEASQNLKSKPPAAKRKSDDELLGKVDEIEGKVSPAVLAILRKKIKEK